VTDVTEVAHQDTARCGGCRSGGRHTNGQQQVLLRQLLAARVMMVQGEGGVLCGPYADPALTPLGCCCCRCCRCCLFMALCVVSTMPHALHVCASCANGVLLACIHAACGLLLGPAACCCLT
jgi:hypothetical protein